MCSSKRTPQDAPPINDGGTSLPTRIFRALVHQRRRYTLYYLRDHEQAQTDDLAIQIVAWEQGVPKHEVPAEEAKRVKTNLVNSQLPKLEDYGLIEYDSRSGAVSYSYPPEILDEALELAAIIETP